MQHFFTNDYNMRKHVMERYMTTYTVIKFKASHRCQTSLDTVHNKYIVAYKYRLKLIYSHQLVSNQRTGHGVFEDIRDNKSYLTVVWERQ